MPAPLPSVDVVRKYVEDSFDVQTPVFALRWAVSGPASERLWELPEGLSILGTPPNTFGLYVRRHAADGYAVRIVWDRAQLSWASVTRVQLLGSCLAPLLKALKLDLWSMLEQPIPTGRPRLRAA